MAKMTVFSRVIHPFFPTFEKKLSGALWILLLCHLAGACALTGSLFIAEFSLVIAGLGGLAFLTAIAAAFAFSRVLKDAAKGINSDIETLFEATGGAEMRLFLPEKKPDSDTGRLLSKSFAQFLQRIRQLVEEIRRIGISVAVDTAKMSGSVSITADQTGKQRAISHEVALASGESSSAVHEISESAQYVADKTAGNLEIVRSSFAELLEVTEKMQQISQSVGQFRKIVDELGQSSASILQVVSTINDIAEQTNLLSLNATIEAARAGEHGKGFAVVAEEVRELAKRVKPATTEISEKINAMIAIVERTEEGTEEIRQYTTETNEAITSTTANFDKMMQDFEQTNEQLVKIASAIEEMSTTNSEVSGKVENIDSLCQEIAIAMEKSASSVESLSDVTESMLELVSRFRTGEGSFDRLMSWAAKNREKAQTEMENLHRQGVNIFDTSYKKVPGTNPQKYETSYTTAFHKTMQPLFDALKKEMQGVIYILAVDSKGYLPTHHAEFAKPPTGDPQRDLLHSRHMRIFQSNRTERRRCSHTKPMLLQTYARDTGEILNDLSLPIHINGRHWGSLIIGLHPDSFQ